MLALGVLVRHVRCGCLNFSLGSLLGFPGSIRDFGYTADSRSNLTYS